jgi:hypothetical protein
MSKSAVGLSAQLFLPDLDATKPGANAAPGHVSEFLLSARRQRGDVTAFAVGEATGAELWVAGLGLEPALGTSGMWSGLDSRPAFFFNSAARSAS